MREGAFAFLDCLGFKGIWRHRNISPEQLLDFLAETKNRSREVMRSESMIEGIHGDQVELKIAFVSDTAIVSTLFREGLTPADNEKGQLVQLAIGVCGDIRNRFLSAPTPLALRGCVTFGGHAVLDSFFAGPAVDEAASLGEISQGAFIWLTPEASSALEASVAETTRRLQGGGQDLSGDQTVALAEEILRRILLIAPPSPSVDRVRAQWKVLARDKKAAALEPLMRVMSALTRVVGVEKDYSMPLKTGGILRATVLNPFIGLNPVEFSVTHSRTLESFDSSSVDVLVKRQNTEAFLNSMLPLALEKYERYAKAVQEIAPELDRILPRPT